MALIGKIRNNPWILIVAIALGLGGFLIMDSVSQAAGPGSGMSQMVVGKVNGEKVRRTEFERVYGLRYGGATTTSPYQNRNGLWDWFTEDRLLNAEAEEVGLAVTGPELNDLEFGDNPSPIIRGNFPNPQQPGAINREQLNYFKQIIENNTIDEEVRQGRLGAQFRDFWLMQRDMIVKRRLEDKLAALVAKGMYTPTWMAEQGFQEQSQYVDFAFVKVPYDQISNEEVVISDSDLSTYLRANAPRFERKMEQRKLEYVAFDVQPTPQDSADLRNKLAALIPEFRTAENDSNFVLRNEGIITPSYYSEGELGSAADTLIKFPVGNVYGPYIEGGSYRIAKILDRHLMSDSAATRHILISAQTPDQFRTANERIDSMMTVLRSGAADFGELAGLFSEDPGSKDNGGEYEGVTPNQFVPEFNEVLFKTGVPGELYKVRTAYGVHLVEVLSRTSEKTLRVQVAYINEPIIPSKETQDNVFQRASRFIAENGDLNAMREAAQADPELRVESISPVNQSSFALGTLGYSNDTKDAICWAFTAQPGDVSATVYTFTDQQRYYDNKYVVVALDDVLQPGLPAVDEIRDELEAEVINEKKAAQIMSTITATDLNAIAGQVGVAVDTVTNVTFNSASLPELGSEPKVLGTAIRLAAGETSAPIQGNSGVFVVAVTRKPAVGQATNLPMIRNRLTTGTRAGVSVALMRYWLQSAEIEDNRSTFECN
jgi:peptidyl-prolyl cis-trans isomerase D